MPIETRPSEDETSRSTPTVSAPARRDSWTTVGPWAGIVAVAVGIAALQPSAGVTTLVLLAAVGAVTERLVRHRRRGLLDGVLVGAGGVASGIGLLALVLAASPIGLTPESVLAGLALIGLIALVPCVGRPLPPSPVGAYLSAARAALNVGTVAVGVAAIILIGGALALSVGSTGASQIPPLALAATSDGATVSVAVTAGTRTGPLTLQTVVDGQVLVVASDVTVGPDHDLTVTLVPEPGTRTIVQLVPVGSATPVRGLVLDTQTPSGGS